MFIIAQNFSIFFWSAPITWNASTALLLISGTFFSGRVGVGTDVVFLQEEQTSSMGIWNPCLLLSDSCRVSLPFLHKQQTAASAIDWAMERKKVHKVKSSRILLLNCCSVVRINLKQACKEFALTCRRNAICSFFLT